MDDSFVLMIVWLVFTVGLIINAVVQICRTRRQIDDIEIGTRTYHPPDPNPPPRGVVQSTRAVTPVPHQQPQATTMKYALSTLNFTQKSCDDECSICIEEIKDGEICRKLLPCQHSFHKNCIDQWLSINNNCPICRAVLI